MGLYSNSHLICYLFLSLALLVVSEMALSQPDRNRRPEIEMRSVEQVLAQHGNRVTMRLKPRFRFVGVGWPPEAVTLLAFKDTRLLELWALSDGNWRHIRDYRVKAMSGGPGPKLREGDLQVPEGAYRIEGLNPMSAYHLSLKLDYPSALDREQAILDGRTNLGGDIYIHGKDVSQGCLAIGDKAIEDLFVLTALLGKEQVSILISPRDFRSRPLLPGASLSPAWIQALYEGIEADLKRFPLENKGRVE